DKTGSLREHAKSSTDGTHQGTRRKRNNTMAFAPRFKEKIVTLTTLHDNLVPRLQEMPHLANDHAALGDLLTQARDLENRQDLAAGELRLINQKRTDLDKQGRNLRSRFGLLLRGTFGANSAELLKYGFSPRAKAVRSKRLSAAERAEQLTREVNRAKAQVEAEAAAKIAAEAAAEAQARARNA
ncbi:MAG TPA: hypothetical protein VGQ28_04795, partial [Thermoanaerobaculia bacterium]|nr:hypothetical protein [Thermoanaerobaculia bacterium]